MRPVSSSTSSTHSSLGAQAAHLNLQKILGYDQKDEMSQFSLIAKYFASFPATRLKCNNQEVKNGTKRNTNIDLDQINSIKNNPKLIQNLSYSNSTNNSTTRFIPFKQPCDRKITTQNVPFSKQTFNTVVSEKNFTPSKLQISGETKLSNFGYSAFKNDNKNLDLQNFQSTDHLCNNFKRLIKLTDSQTIPVGELYKNLVSTQSITTIAQSPEITSAQVEFDSNTDLGENRLGQIQMETRSTRKFLIKHHSYLQHINTQEQQKSSKNCPRKIVQQRPSINLIKMKRLKRKATSRATEKHIKESEQSKNRYGKKPCQIFNKRYNSHLFLINIRNIIFVFVVFVLHQDQKIAKKKRLFYNVFCLI